MAKRSRSATRGQAMVEAALTLPLLLVLFMGIADVGRAFTTYIAVANAAREGARYCALHPGDSAGTRSRVAGELGDRVAADTASVTCPTAERGQPIAVIVSASLTPITPYGSQLVGGAITLQAPATMVVW